MPDDTDLLNFDFASMDLGHRAKTDRNFAAEQFERIAADVQARQAKAETTPGAIRQESAARDLVVVREFRGGRAYLWRRTSTGWFKLYPTSFRDDAALSDAIFRAAEKPYPLAVCPVKPDSAPRDQIVKAVFEAVARGRHGLSEIRIHVSAAVGAQVADSEVQRELQRLRKAGRVEVLLGDWHLTLGELRARTGVA